ncbi:MAG TPA: AlkA N-terminal domain-containing protein [Egibacteraceae bacterium]
MIDDFERCYRAVCSRDARFDGCFVVGVLSTGIYCRPSCPARTPLRRNVRFFAGAAAAQRAGLRACRRCRPDAVPGSPDADVRADVVGRALRLIADGVVDREGVSGLARRLGYSERHLQRLLVAEVGASALALARAQRAQTARVLVETTTLPLAQVAFAAGFASVRQFNDTVREVFAATPTQLRRDARRRRDAAPAPGVIALRLPYRRPFAAAPLWRFLAERAVPGVEDGDETRYRRALSLPHGDGVVTLTPARDHVACHLRLSDLRDLAPAVQRCRRLLDLDADIAAVEEVLGADPHLGPLVRARPGLRVPGTVDAAELALRAVVGQQVSVAAARTIAARLVARYGKPLDAPDGTITHRFCDPAALADADPATLPLPRSRARALVRLAAALAGGEVVVDPGADRDEAVAALRALPGIGEWTASYVALRGLGDPDALPAADLGLRRAAARLGLPDDPAGLRRAARAWRPWRAYAAEHLWTSLTGKDPS